MKIQVMLLFPLLVLALAATPARAAKSGSRQSMIPTG